jgi:hypothetical protein
VVWTSQLEENFLIKEMEDLKGFHELLGTFLRRMEGEPVPGSLAQRLSAEDLEVIGKMGLVMKSAPGAEPLKPNESETALDLLKALVRDLSAFDSDDPISGSELVGYMANFYLLAKCHLRQES